MVEQNTCSIPAANTQQSSTRGVDSFPEQIVFGATSHGWNGPMYTFIPCRYPKHMICVDILFILILFWSFLI